MADVVRKAGKPAYAPNHWGPLAHEPWADLAPVTPAWRQVVKRAWLRDGGSEQDYAVLFGRDEEAGAGFRSVTVPGSAQLEE